jgi:hypothetical protein
MVGEMTGPLGAFSGNSASASPQLTWEKIAGALNRRI